MLATLGTVAVLAFPLATFPSIAPREENYLIPLLSTEDAPPKPGVDYKRSVIELCDVVSRNVVYDLSVGLSEETLIDQYVTQFLLNDPGDPAKKLVPALAMERAIRTGYRMRRMDVIIATPNEIYRSAANACWKSVFP